MRRLVIAALVLAGFVAGCDRGPRYAGGSFGSCANADSETTTEVARQRDPEGDLLFVIAWTAKHGGGPANWSWRNQLTGIHGHAVRPSLDDRAVYALQPDYSLERIPLTEEQTAALFREMQGAGFHTSHSELWQKEVAPHLVRVEAPDGG